MFSRFGVQLKHSIRRRIIVNPRSSCIQKQMRLSNLQWEANKPTRFIYHIEYTIRNTKNGGRNFIPHLINQG